MDDPIGSIDIRSKFIIPTRLSFDIILKDDIINVDFQFLPNKNKPWNVSYQSSKYGSGIHPLYNVKGKERAKPIDIANALCKELDAGKPIKVKNICRNYVDLYIPKFIELSLIKPNYPKQSTKIDRIIGYVLFADLRGFSTWSLSAEPEQISEIYEVISDRVVQMLIDYHYDYWKLLGDGIMLVWQSREDESATSDCAIGAAYELHKEYWYYRKDSLSGVPKGFGIAICAGHLTKFSSATFFESCVVNDYLGPIVNQAARLQTLAKPGEVLVNKRVAKMSKDNWYTFENITNILKDDINNIKGLSPQERNIFKIKHKYFNSNWDDFCK